MIREAPDVTFTCFLDDHAARIFAPPSANLRTVLVPQHRAPTLAAAAGSSRHPTDMLRLTRAVARERLDVFFSPSVYTYFPLPPGLPAVVTVHDTIAERFPALTMPTLRARLFWGAKVRLALWQARLVLTVSDYAAREIADVLGVAPHRLRVSGEAPAPAFLGPPPSPGDIAAAAGRAGLPTGSRWFTYVGGFSPHKHVDVLVRAHARVCAGRAAPPHLVLAGALSGDVFLGALETIRSAVAAAGTGHLVHWPGFLPDEELRSLHAGALALVLPSAAEGFGLPAIEAAACGAPVVATTASPLPGLLEGGGLFVEPGDVDALATAMGQLLDDEPRRVAMAGVARGRARSLSWEAAARVALGALREAAA